MLTRPLMAHFSLSKVMFWIRPASILEVMCCSQTGWEPVAHTAFPWGSLSVLPFLLSLSYFFFVSDKILKYTEVALNCYSLLKKQPSRWIRHSLRPLCNPIVYSPTQALGTIAIQLAHHRGAKVISTACSLEDKQFLERFRPPIGE